MENETPSASHYALIDLEQQHIIALGNALLDVMIKNAHDLTPAEVEVWRQKIKSLREWAGSDIESMKLILEHWKFVQRRQAAINALVPFANNAHLN